jgi:nucleotide-binding universal stress UspA family protein
MLKIKSILCPVDFSDHSRHALAHAVQLARWFESSVTVLHVYPPPIAPPPMLFGGLPGPLPPAEPYRPETVSPDRTYDDVYARLTHFTSTFDTSGLALNVAAHEGAATQGILDMALRLPSDLIVLGTHGHSGFEHLVLGSVTEKVLRKAPCPVLTVPPQVAEAPHEAQRIFERILCAIDFSEASLKGLEYALSLAKETNAELLLLYVIEGVPDAPDWQQPAGPAAREYVALSEAEARKRFRVVMPHDADTWCRPDTILATGKSYREILRVARERDAHLIVMGVHGTGAVDRFFFGSTTNHVVRTATCPVLTLRA